jgi:hypothetical protein
MEQLPICSRSDLVDDSRLQVQKHRSWHIFASASLRKESTEGIIAASYSFVAGHLAIGLDAVLQTEKFPTSVSDLNTSLTNVDGNNLSHSLYLLLVFAKN